LDNQKLALFGGEPINKGPFLKSNPKIDREEKNAVIELMEKAIFSRFVGSPIEGTYDDLDKETKDLRITGNQSTFLGGENIRNFESDWSDIVGSKFSISVNSATSGLTTALLSLNLEPGTIVLTTPFSFTGTVGAILAANCVPKFSDIDLDTFCLNPEKLSEDLKDVGCLMPVHWCGNAGDLEDIISIAKNKDIPLVEDAAQAPATLYKKKYLGTYGDIGVFSFNEPKNLMTGEGGMIVTNNKDYAVKSRLIRNHGEAIVKEDFSKEELINVIGYNFRLTEIQAAIGIQQLKKLDFLNEIRAKNYKYLIKSLNETCGEYLTPQKITHPESYFAYTASFRWNPKKSGIKREVIAAALNAEGIPTFTAYGKMLPEHPAFQNKISFGSNGYPWNLTTEAMKIDYKPSNFPNTRKLIEEEFIGFLTLGWPNGLKEMDMINLAFRKIMSNKKKLKSISVENKNINIGR
tara:strand:- start:14936 stop:16324 length:1389 start_codon:yes stop_codon:yes gene_type:complete